jgi:hypothetical protein
MQHGTTPRRRAGSAALAALAVGSAVLAGCNGDAGTQLWRRDLDPVVLTGAQVTDLVGTAPGDVVAFRWNTALPGWQQVPVQADERHVEYLTKLRNGTGTSGPQALAYSDPGANAGADPVATFDANDEIAFMTDDTGGRAPSGTGDPSGVVAASGVRVTVTDPLAEVDGNRGGGLGYVYLFERSSGALSPGAGLDYVDYDFDPADPSGHAEDSTVTSDRYSTHFSARWTRDQLRIGAGVDILDRHRNLFAAGVCTRSEDTFSAGAGGYATNVDGPVRVIRSYLGANSGTYTQREHIFYRGAERVQTFLRVHAIPGILDFYDYSAAAIGMRYSSSSTPAGVVIDGVPDSVGSAAPTWEAVTGSGGALISTTAQVTDISGMAVQSYYTDDATPPFTQCTGDAFEYGASGTAITSAIPNTDPTLSGSVHNLTATRWNLYVRPQDDLSVDWRVANLTTPVTVAIAPFVPGA